MFRKLKMMSSVVAFVFLLTGAVFAQETTGNIEVTVTDPQGGRVPGATVQVTSGSAFDRTVTTDTEGFVRVLQLQPGFYTVRISAGNFRTTVREQVEVVLGKTTPVTVDLQVGVATEEVVVSATDVAPIDPTDNKIQTNITAAAVELLPKGTNFTSALKVAPAVRTEAGGFQIDGASGSENTFIIDGQEVTNFRTGTLNTNNNIPFQFVQEVQVKTSGFEAEFGGATGGVVNVVTKSGGNDWHGEFGAQFRPAGLQAGPRQFLNLLPRAGTTFGVAQYVRPERDKGTDFFPTANLSGPIIKDRAWFFASYTPQFLHTERTVAFLNPSTFALLTPPIGANNPDTYKSSQTNEYFFLRTDANIFQQLRFTASYTWNPIIIDGVLPARGAEFSPIPSITFPGGTVLRGTNWYNSRGGRQNSQNVTGGFVWTPTANLLVNTRGGYSFLNEKSDTYNLPNPVGIWRALCSSGGVADKIPAEAGCTLGQQNFPAFSALLFDVSRRKTFDADASYIVSNFLGRHQFKGGFQFNALSNNVSSQTVDQVVLQYGRSINTVSGVDEKVLPPSPNAIGAGFIRRFATRGFASSNNKAFYFQDSWQPTSRISINAGLRFEKESAPSFTPGNASIEFSWMDKIAPRLGFATDLTGDGKTKLFASYGWFYDRFKYELPRGSFGGDFFRDDYFEIFPGFGNFQTITPTKILGAGNFTAPAGGQCPVTVPGALVRCEADFRIPSNLGLGLEFGAIDPNLKPFRQSEFTVGFERQLTGGLFTSGRYTHKQVDHAIEDIGFLNAAGSEAYIIGNPGEGLAAQVSRDFGFEPLKAKRDYDAVEVRLDKRFTNNWYTNISYTWSRLFGNYSGLASTDETSNGGQGGRNSPNVNRNFDLPFIGYTGQGRPDNGRLATDRPHVFKAAAGYTLNWNRWAPSFGKNSTEFTMFTTAQSGTPVTTRFTFYRVDNTILNGRGDLGRLSSLTQTDFGVRHRYRFGANERFAMIFDVDILNLFNESNELRREERLNSGANVTGGVIGLPSDEALAIAAFQRQSTRDAILKFINTPLPQKAGDPPGGGGIVPTFNLPVAYQAPREVRFGFRLQF